MGYLGIIIVALMFVTVSKILQVCRIVVWRPYAVTECFRNQGIMGPSYSILSGSLGEMKKLRRVAMGTALNTNSHDITERVIPHFTTWSSQYGETFLYWYGLQPRLFISDPELAKHILSNKSNIFVKPKARPTAEIFAGKGLPLINGLDWFRHRKIANPAFSMDKLKGMVKGMATCTVSMLDDWKNHAISSADDQCREVEVHGEFKRLMADIIAHTAFGSSFVAGKEAFKAQLQLQQCCAASSTDTFIPGSQYLPTPSNIHIWKLDRKVKETLKSIIDGRLNSPTTGNSNRFGNDLLGTMIDALDIFQSRAGPKLNMEEIIEECKAFFVAGHGTTASFLTWTVFLLCKYPEWQTKLREEVLNECVMRIPDADMLAKLKLVNMVFLEALRLYCPVIRLFRQGSEDTSIGNLMIPRDTCIEIALVEIHRSEKYWGEDAKEFNPLRFINGISQAAKHPNALLEFGFGPRTCIGQNLAMLAGKTTITLILQRFSLSLSPEYKHTPVDNLLLEPQFGLPIVAKPLQ
ncbi:hypothetical protein LWI28_016065 [Acer negundo]|uniref:Cytochrome P450 n=1 Tax=Acer negundo TaxID=4023 RepID=A0AAD5NTA4_ACENE|nr:hypothetical protein LWI28_016065 [Acer negundo]